MINNRESLYDSALKKRNPGAMLLFLTKKKNDKTIVDISNRESLQYLSSNRNCEVKVKCVFNITEHELRIKKLTVILSFCSMESLSLFGCSILPLC